MDLRGRDDLQEMGNVICTRTYCALWPGQGEPRAEPVSLMIASPPHPTWRLAVREPGATGVDPALCIDLGELDLGHGGRGDRDA